MSRATKDASASSSPARRRSIKKRKTPSSKPSAASPRRAVASPLKAAALPSSLLVSALRSLPEGVVIAPVRPGKRSNLRIAFANDHFCAMTGFMAAELFDKDLTSFHVDAHQRNRQRRWSRSVRAEHTYAAEGFLKRRDGTSLFAAWRLSALSDRNGHVTHVVVSYRDLTEKRQLQEALIQAQRIDAVGQLAGGIAHDFNNLLSVINGYSEILAERLASDDRASHDVAEIHHAGQKASALTRQLLAFSRRNPVDPRVLNLNDLVQTQADLLRRFFHPQHQLHLSLSPEPANVRIDVTAFHQILLNLALNARDALKPGGRVTLSTEKKAFKKQLSRRRGSDIPAGNYVVLSVSDNGSGMDLQVQSRAFEPFFTTKPEGKGTGLGLAQVYGLVQQSGGYILVHSAPGVGSRFDLYLPEVEEAASASPPLPATTAATRGHEAIMIVEADDVLRKMIAGILTADGYSVTALAEGHSLETGTRVPDLLLIDLSDPEARTVIGSLSAKRPSVKVITTSNHRSPPYQSSSTGAQAHLAKPFALSTLLKAIRTLLDTGGGQGIPPSSRSPA